MLGLKGWCWTVSMSRNFSHVPGPAAWSQPWAPSTGGEQERVAEAHPQVGAPRAPTPAKASRIGLSRQVRPTRVEGGDEAPLAVGGVAPLDQPEQRGRRRRSARRAAGGGHDAHHARPRSTWSRSSSRNAPTAAAMNRASA